MDEVQDEAQAQVAEAERADGPITFEMYGRTWTIPARPPFGFTRRLAKTASARSDGERAAYILDAIAFIAGDGVDMLDDQPTEDADTFLAKVSELYGLGDSGN